MRAYKGIVREGVIVPVEGARLPEGAVVTITIGEAEYLRARLRASLRRSTRRRARALLPAFRATRGQGS